MRVSAVPPRGTGGFPAAAGASGFNAALGSFIPTPQHNINSTVTLHAAQSGTIPSSPGSFTKKLGVSRKLCPNPCDLSKAGGGGEGMRSSSLPSFPGPLQRDQTVAMTLRDAPLSCPSPMTAVVCQISFLQGAEITFASSHVAYGKVKAGGGDRAGKGVPPPHGGWDRAAKARSQESPKSPACSY